MKLKMAALSYQQGVTRSVSLVLATCWPCSGVSPVDTLLVEKSANHNG
jgi:hypothetical protein